MKALNTLTAHQIKTKTVAMPYVYSVHLKYGEATNFPSATVLPPQLLRVPHDSRALYEIYMKSAVSFCSSTHSKAHLEKYENLCCDKRKLLE